MFTESWSHDLLLKKDYSFYRKSFPYSYYHFFLNYYDSNTYLFVMLSCSL